MRNRKTIAVVCFLLLSRASTVSAQNLVVNGTITVQKDASLNTASGNTTINGNTTLGSSNFNTITYNGVAATNLDMGENQILNLQNVTIGEPFGIGSPYVALTGTIKLYNSGGSGTATIQSANPGSTNYTYTVPASGANASFVMTAGNQTINGTKSFGTPIATTSGGTGTATLPSGYLLLGNGASAVTAGPAWNGSTLTGNISGSAASATSFSGTLSGDVSGTQTNTSVDKIKGNAVPTDAAGVLTNDGSGTLSWTPANTGTVTDISVASANGLAGTSSGGATPQLTLSTTVSGILLGDGTSISAATPSDFPTLNQNTTGTAAGFTGTLSGDVSGTQSNTSVDKIKGNTVPTDAAGVLTNDGSGTLSWTPANTGTVTDISVASANGLAGTSSGGATPELTLSTTVSGILLGDGTSISAATPSDFPTLNQNTTGTAAGFTGTLSGDVSGTQSNTSVDKIKGNTVPTDAAGVLTNDGSGALSWTPANMGTVTDISVASANGLAGTSSGGATPELTLSTTVSGILLGDGTSISAATPSDFPTLNQNTTGTAAGFTGTLSGDVSGTQSNTSVDKIKGNTVPTDAAGVLTNDGSGALSWTPANMGTVTDISVASANGLAGTSSGGATPELTLSTTVSGILLGDGTSISAASASDFPTLNQNTTGTAAGFTGTLSGDVSGTQSNTSVDKIKGNTVPTDAAGVLTNDGSGVLSWTPANTGTVTDISVASANGLAGTSSGGATPQLTLSTTVSGILLGDGTSISAASASDFPTLNQNTTGTAAGFTGTLSGDVSGTQSNTSVDKIKGNTVPTDAAGVLTNDGSGVLTWTAAGAGTVTSVGMSVPSFLSVTPSTITSSGSFAVTLSGSALPVANGGTGVSTVSGTNHFFANTTTGSAPAFRSFALTDLPNESATTLLGNWTNSGAAPGEITLGTGLAFYLGQLKVTSAPPSGTASGDLGSAYPNPTVVSVAHVNTGVLYVPNGGTGLATIPAHSVMLGEDAGNVAVATPGSGSTGYVLTSNGNSSDPTWQAPTGGGVTSVSNSDGSLTISPTSGAVVGSLNVGHANIWSVTQTFPATDAQGSAFASSINNATTTLINGSQINYGTVTANYVFAAPNGSAGAPTFRQLVAADFSGTYLPLAGGNMTGSIAMGGHNITGGGTAAFTSITATPTSPNAGLTINGSSTGNDVTGNAWSVTHAGAATFSSVPTPGAIGGGTASTGRFTALTATNTTNQLTLGTGTVDVISASAPAASRTYTMADMSGNASFVLTTATPVNTTIPEWNGTLGNLANSSITDNGTTVSTTENLSLTGAKTLQIGTAGSATGSLAFANATGTNLTTIKAGASAPAFTYILPTSAPTAGQVLSSDASGNLSWIDASGSGSSGILAGGTGTTGTDLVNGNYYNPAAIMTGSGNSTADITNNNIVIASQSGTLSNLYAQVAAPPGSGRTWIFQLRDLTTGTYGDTAKITGSSGRTGNSGSSTLSVSAGDSISLLVTSTNSPTTAHAIWSMNFAGSSSTVSNLYKGTAHISVGSNTVTVSNSNVTSSSIIMLTINTVGNTYTGTGSTDRNLKVTAISNGTSFTVGTIGGGNVQNDDLYFNYMIAN